MKADLSQKMKSCARIIPNAEVQNTVDEDARKKLRHRDKKGAKHPAEEKRHTGEPAIEQKDHEKGSAADGKHGGMGMSAPKDLNKPITHAADKKSEKRLFPFAETMGAAQDQGFQEVPPSFPARAFASFLRYRIAVQSPPTSSTSPSATASSPSMMAPTSVASSSVR